MTREEARKLLPAITHFADGGDLYLYKDNLWKEQQSLFIDKMWAIQNIIKDKHFKARKAFALGEPVEVQYKDSTWHEDIHPKWEWQQDFRPKPKEPVYDYHFTFRRGDEWFMSLGRWQRLEEAMHFITGKDMTRFEPSKRIRK